VYVLEQDDKGDLRAKRKAVKFATRENDSAMITSGLSLGETVATVGSAKLNEGMLVNVQEASE
jgi:membrane fusion protein (multidrug efflux system)